MLAKAPQSAERDKVEVPCACHFIPILQGIGKVVKRVEEQHRNRGLLRAKHVGEHHEPSDHGDF